MNLRGQSCAQIVTIALLALTSEAVAFSAEKTSYPVVSFDRYEPVAPSLLIAKSVAYDVMMSNEAFQVVSTWTIDNAIGAHEILLGSDAERGAKIAKVVLDGTEVNTEKVEGNERYVRIKNADGRGQPVMTLVVTSTLPTDGPQDALQLLSTYMLPKPGRLVKKDAALGWDLRALSRHSYGDPVRTTFKIKTAAGWLTAGSSVTKPADPSTFDFQPATTGRFAVVLGHKDFWQLEPCSVEGLDCVLIAKAKGANLSAKLMQSLLAKVADQYGQRFGKAADHIVMVDSDWDAISGGLLGSNILGFFAKNAISSDEQAGFKDSFGWAPKISTSSYVAELYKTAKDPWGAYMTGMLAHELAHLYFGFGRTSERVVDLHELWFSLGMGLVYDEIVTKAITGRLDAFFAAVEDNWRTKFSTNKALDQRLVNPDTSKDQDFKLSRAHVYAHGYRVFRSKLLAIAPKLPEYEKELGVL